MAAVRISKSCHSLSRVCGAMVGREFRNAMSSGSLQLLGVFASLRAFFWFRLDRVSKGYTSTLISGDLLNET